jgi:hypothetical protein
MRTLFAAGLAFFFPLAAHAADFRLMNKDSGGVRVTDFQQMHEDRNGVRHFTYYIGSRPFTQAALLGKQFAVMSFALDCPGMKMRLEGLNMLASDYSVSSSDKRLSSWLVIKDMKPVAPPLDAISTLCASNPAEVSRAPKLSATDWKSALSEALKR